MYYSLKICHIVNHSNYCTYCAVYSLKTAKFAHFYPFSQHKSPIQAIIRVYTTFPTVLLLLGTYKIFNTIRSNCRTEFVESSGWIRKIRQDSLQA